MTANPGFGQQPLLRTTLSKIGRVRELVERLKPGCEGEVDGGMDATTAPLVVRAGAIVLAGSAIFGDREGVPAAIAACVQPSAIWTAKPSPPNGRA